MAKARLKQLESYEIRVKRDYACYSTQEEILKQTRGEIDRIREKIKQLEQPKIKCI